MAMKRLDDRDLITEYLKGNEKAFEVLLMRHKDKIFRFIHLKLRDRVLAEDVFQETFVKIINTLKLGSYNEEGKFLPWAMRIAHNLVIDHFRKASKVRMISESSSSREDFNIFDVLSLTDKNIEQKITYDELEKQMVDLIEFLPATQKEILKMRIFQDMSFKDIAESEDISINTALGRMRYALINLRKLIDKHQLVTDI
ncbi:MAG: sigma-70 family RNA polymerase sigma factor [Crocinitomicaceae bacterium]|nr:sigma-70 family RNA polymerase sigma factor [Crocinitomicaceae bacterium]